MAVAAILAVRGQAADRAVAMDVSPQDNGTNAFGPVVLMGTLLAGAPRSRLAAAVVAVLVLVAVAAWASGIADGPVVGRWAAAFGAGLLRTAPRMLVLLFLAAGGALWLAVGWAAARRTSGGAPAEWTRPEAAARWGRVATLVAVLCPLPYALGAPPG